MPEQLQKSITPQSKKYDEVIRNAKTLFRMEILKLNRQLMD
jgi:hypothetical protein